MTAFSSCIVAIIPAFALIFIPQQSNFNLSGKPVVFSFISWLRELYLPVFCTRRAHQIFKMFISCLYAWAAFWVSKIFLGYSLPSWGYYKHCYTICWYENLPWGNLRSALFFFPLVNKLAFWHSSPKILCLWSLVASWQYVSLFLCPGSWCVLSILQIKSSFTGF